MWKNKIIIFSITICIIMCGCNVYADDEDEDFLENNIEEIVVESSSKCVDEPNINARNAVIFDRETKKIIWGKNENKITAMASTTKIMTAIIVLENSNLNDIVTISKKAANTGGSRLKISTGDKITVNDLLYGLMLRSGNDAAVALAEHVGGNIEGFSNMMNKKTKELGLKNTNFVTPHGLDNDKHYTTAYELALITDYALNNKKFSEIVKTKMATIYINRKGRNIYNTNELLGNLNGVDGVKTGFTGNAGRCLVTSTTRNGNQIITVVLGADTKKQRTSDSIKLIEYAFENYEKVNIEEIVKKDFENWKQINEGRIYINKAKEKEIELVVGEVINRKIPIKKGEEKDIQTQINCIYEYEAPILKGEKIGNIVIKKGDEILEIVDIVCNKTVERKDIKVYLIDFFNRIVFKY